MNFERVMGSVIHGSLPISIIIVALLLGVLALQLTPREEEPQIVVPIIDIEVDVPGASADQVERQVTVPLEKLLAQIPGVEHVYSTTQSQHTTVTLRFYVGEDREVSLLNTYNKLYSHQDEVPSIVGRWVVKPVEVDDVAILLIGLWSEDAQRYSDFHLRRLAEEVANDLQAISDVSDIRVQGGRPRHLQIELKPDALAARQTTATDIVSAIRRSNNRQFIGDMSVNNESIRLEAGSFFQDVEELRQLPVNLVNGHTVYLKDVATVVDGPAVVKSYQWLSFSDALSYPLVTISIAKQRGSNAVAVAEAVQKRLGLLEKRLFPASIHTEVLRDYGKTANEKVDNLLQSLGFAVFTVVVFIGLFLGWRPALVVALAVPICYGITLGFDYALGYTINRVTLFALILSLGLLVDDPITGVDNIQRYLINNTQGGKVASIIGAMAEIRGALFMSTLTIVLAFVPLAFITGMMGPYMAPMAFNVPISVIVSTLVAFFVTPWLAKKLLSTPVISEVKPESKNSYYERLLRLLLNHRYASLALLIGVFLLFVGAALLPAFRAVPLKLLPFDNKNELQIVIDMPEGTTLESTAAMAEVIAQQVKRLPEVAAVAAYVGEPSAVDFNGLVRRYYQRVGVHLADLRLILLDKKERLHQSHHVVLRLRKLLKPFAQNGIVIRVVEVPPGPPVLATLVGEVTGNIGVSYETLERNAQQLMARLSREAHVVEVDSSVEKPRILRRFIPDRQKAALSAISQETLVEHLAIANGGYIVDHLQLAMEIVPVPIEVRLPDEALLSPLMLTRLSVRGQGALNQSAQQGRLSDAPTSVVSVAELGAYQEFPVNRQILRKDLKPVVYVTAEISGRTPAAVIADLNADNHESFDKNDGQRETLWSQRNFFSPGGGDAWLLDKDVQVSWNGEGEWRITLRVFRDMGIAFAFALMAIYWVLRLQTRSTALSLIIMLSIPLTIIGIMPGFFMLNQFGERYIAGAPEPVLFTATAMIGMIALAGIVVRNALILVEFISQSRRSGMLIKDALVSAGMVRMRPVLLTAGTTLLGNLVIILDPVFSGLALAIIFGILSSTVFTLFVVPVVYYLVFSSQEPVQNNEVVR